MIVFLWPSIHLLFSHLRYITKEIYSLKYIIIIILSLLILTLELANMCITTTGLKSIYLCFHGMEWHASEETLNIWAKITNAKHYQNKIILRRLGICCFILVQIHFKECSENILISNTQWCITNLHTFLYSSRPSNTIWHHVWFQWWLATSLTQLPKPA